MRTVRAPLALFLATAFAGLTLCAPAQAIKDGGVRSPFAHGAGNRSLAMGGATAALVDDASAPVWNPAGLGLLARSELQGASARLYGLDVSEHWVSAAWPSWRWGAVAASFRRLSVAGIERRDDRNVLLSEFEDAESELGIAWGKRLAEAWTVGGAVKLQRQQIAGFDGTGLGMDVGVQALPGLVAGAEGAWARRLRLGLAVRNVIEPTIRLDEESVPDPTAVRGGLAYRQPLPAGRAVLGAVDVERASGGGARLHAGLEVLPHELLALRAGWNGVGWTVGTGIRWQGVSVDWVMEDDPLDTVHRFGATFAFGPTVEESRQAAVQREEEAFGRRLAETFRKRQQARADELAERGEQLLRERRWDDAIDAASTLVALAPDDPRAADLQTRALAQKALLAEMAQDFSEASILYGRVLAIEPGHGGAMKGLARCRDESDRRAERTARIRERMAEALDAFVGGDLVLARDRLRDVLVVAPDDAEARAMLGRTEAAIDARVAALGTRARRSIERQILDDAADAIDEMRTFDPDASSLADLVARLRRAETELAEAARAEAAGGDGAALAAAPTPAPVPKAPALSRKKREEISDLYRRGMEAMQEDHGDDALRYWELVWMADPDYQRVAEFLKREYLLRGLESFSRGRIDESIGLWEKALEVDPADERTRGYLARAREQRMRAEEILGTRP